LLFFDLLGPVSSACFGLSCKRLYKTYRKVHPRPISIYESEWSEEAGEYKRQKLKLHYYLRHWMWNGAKLLWGGKYGLKFINLERKTAGEKMIKDAFDHSAAAYLDWGSKARKYHEAAATSGSCDSKLELRKRVMDPSFFRDRSWTNPTAEETLLLKALERWEESKLSLKIFATWKLDEIGDEFTMKVLGLEDSYVTLKGRGMTD
jgi:hypothetical protein